jgi:hypothetical protein
LFLFLFLNNPSSISNFFSLYFQVKLVCLAAAAPPNLFDDKAASKNKNGDTSGGEEEEDKNHGDLLGDSTYLQKSYDEVWGVLTRLVTSSWRFKYACQCDMSMGLQYGP